MTATDVSLMPLVMQLSRTRASTIDVPAVLSTVCSAISGVMGIGGVVVLLAEPLEGCRLSASDDRAAWIGETQLRAEVGPLAGALRTGRPMLTLDITRVGPPAMAAAAAECGLLSSLVVPFGVDGEWVGALQLLGEAHRPVEPADADAVLPVVEVLATRLVDVRDLRQASAARPEPTALSSADDADVLVPSPRKDLDGRSSPERTPRSSAESARRPEPRGEQPSDTGESSPSEATTPALRAVPSQGRTWQPGVSSAPIAQASPAPSTTPRAFAPRPTPRPRPGRDPQ